MKNHSVRLLVARVVLLALLFANVACASSPPHSNSRSSAASEFGTVQTGSYIPRLGRKPESGKNAKTAAKSKPQKRTAKAAAKKPAATERADEDYVPRGGFR